MEVKKRITWIDVAKGVAILIVVFGHSGVVWVNPYIMDSNDIFLLLGRIGFYQCAQ